MTLTESQRDLVHRIWFAAIRAHEERSDSLTMRTVTLDFCDLRVLVFSQRDEGTNTLQTIAPGNGEWIVRYDGTGFSVAGDPDALARDFTCIRIALPDSF